jgi:hypothetical protein
MIFSFNEHFIFSWNSHSCLACYCKTWCISSNSQASQGINIINKQSLQLFQLQKKMQHIVHRRKLMFVRIYIIIVIFVSPCAAWWCTFFFFVLTWVSQSQCPWIQSVAYLLERSILYCSVYTYLVVLYPGISIFF